MEQEQERLIRIISLLKKGDQNPFFANRVIMEILEGYHKHFLGDLNDDEEMELLNIKLKNDELQLKAIQESGIYEAIFQKTKENELEIEEKRRKSEEATETFLKFNKLFKENKNIFKYAFKYSLKNIFYQIDFLKTEEYVAALKFYMENIKLQYKIFEENGMYEEVS